MKLSGKVLAPVLDLNMFSNLNSLQRFYMAMLLLMLSASFYFHANLGGTGFRIPNNIFVWLFAGIAAFIGILQFSKKTKYKVLQFDFVNKIFLSCPNNPKPRGVNWGN